MRHLFRILRSSDAFMLGLVLLAFTPVFPAWGSYRFLSIDTATGRGIYLAGLIIFAVGFLWRRSVESASDERGRQELKDQLSQMEVGNARRHLEVTQHQTAEQKETRNAIESLHAAMSAEIRSVGQSALLSNADELSVNLQAMLDFTFDQLDRAVYNDWLGKEAVSDIHRIIADISLSIETRIRMILDIVGEYNKDLKHLAPLHDLQMHIITKGMVPPTLPNRNIERLSPPKSDT